MNPVNRSRFQNAACVLLAMMQLALCACEQTNPSTSQPAPTTAAHKAASPWHRQNGSTVVVVPDEASDRAMNDAIARARAAAADARQRWSQSPAEERTRWAVKWAAPLESNAQAAARIEYVWVRPVNWSAFRIEGVLASDPVDELAGGQKLGDLVSFPIDELADWVHFTSGSVDDFSGTYEGGFTLKVLEDRFGKPPDSPANSPPNSPPNSK